MSEVEARLRDGVDGRSHGLAVPLVVTLTSYPARFRTLHLTLASLLLQTVRPDAVILWVGRGQARDLPGEVLALRPLGLEVAEADDLGPYTKIVPSLLAQPEAALLTADDDVHYPPDTVAELVAGTLARPGAVVARRAHRVTLGPGGWPRPYADWRMNIPGPEQGPRVFPTGVGGVLYPPGCLHPDAARTDLFLSLAPRTDDIWLWWMHRLAGGAAAKTGGGRLQLACWPGSQATALQDGNLGGGGNDRAVAAMIGRYGLPPGTRTDPWPPIREPREMVDGGIP